MQTLSSGAVSRRFRRACLQYFPCSVRSRNTLRFHEKLLSSHNRCSILFGMEPDSRTRTGVVEVTNSRGFHGRPIAEVIDRVGASRAHFHLLLHTSENSFGCDTLNLGNGQGALDFFSPQNATLTLEVCPRNPEVCEEELEETFERMMKVVRHAAQSGKYDN